MVKLSPVVDGVDSEKVSRKVVSALSCWTVNGIMSGQLYGAVGKKVNQGIVERRGEDMLPLELLCDFCLEGSSPVVRAVRSRSVMLKTGRAARGIEGSVEYTYGSPGPAVLGVLR